MKTAPEQPQATYRLAKLVKAKKKRWYIEFYAMCPIRKTLVRKRFYAIPGDSQTQKEFRARLIIKQINRQLKDGFMLKTDPSNIRVPVKVEKETISTETPKLTTVRDLMQHGASIAI